MDQSALIASDKYSECCQLIKAQMVSIQNFAFQVLSDNHTAFYLKIVPCITNKEDLPNWQYVQLTLSKVKWLASQSTYERGKKKISWSF